MLTVTDTPRPTVRATKLFECMQRGFTSFYPALCRNEAGEVIPAIRIDTDGELKGAVAFNGWPTLSITCKAESLPQLNSCLRKDKNGHWYVRALVEGERYVSDVADEQGKFPVWLENASVQVISR